MNTSPSVYSTRLFTGKVPTFAEMVREWSDAELEAFSDVQFSDWDRYVTAGDRSSAEYRCAQLEDVAAEKRRRIEVRERHAGDPLAPQWSETKEREYEQLKALASYLKERWPILRFMGELMAVDLRLAGKAYVGRCPFPDHDDKTPSFHAYPADDHWHCFGCDRTGDVFDLVGVYFGLDSFRDQIDKLAEATPDVPEKLKRSARPQRKRRGVRLQGGKLVAA